MIDWLKNRGTSLLTILALLMLSFASIVFDYTIWLISICIDGAFAAAYLSVIWLSWVRSKTWADKFFFALIVGVVFFSVVIDSRESDSSRITDTTFFGIAFIIMVIWYLARKQISLWRERRSKSLA